MSDTAKVRVTLDVPKQLIPEGEKEPAEALTALITAALWEFRIGVVEVSKRDAKKFAQGGVK
jgi:hypothetical protein